MKEETNVLKGEDALALARQGAKAWNAWASSHKRWTVDFAQVDFTRSENQGVSFGGFVFSGAVDFSNAVFGDSISFGETEFYGSVNFFCGEFTGFASFYKARFRQAAHFSAVQFQETSFDGARFFKIAQFDAATFSSNASFRSNVFSGDVSFSLVTFEGLVEFNWSVFERTASFIGAKIRGDMECLYADFGGNLNFTGALFEGDTSFNSSTFSRAVALNDCNFQTVPNFLNTKFDYHVSMDSIEIAFDGRRLWQIGNWQLSESEDDAAKFRRLKELAILAQDHRQEQNFFAMEQKAMRRTRYQGAALFLSVLYETLSDFGRSVSRPVLGVFSVWFLYGLIYFVASYAAMEMKRISLSLVSTALLYSATQILPFISGAGEVKARAVEKLFMGDIPWYLGWLNIFEGLFAFIFLFLIGLALRNRFRI